MKLIVESPDAKRVGEFALGSVPLTIGREPDCAITLPSDYASRRHAIVKPVTGGHEIQAYGVNGTYVNKKLLREGQSCPLEARDVVSIAGYTLRVIDETSETVMEDESLELTREYSELLARLHERLLQHIDLRSLAIRQLADEERHRRFTEAFDAVLGGQIDAPQELQEFMVLKAAEDGLMDRLVLEGDEGVASAVSVVGLAVPLPASDPQEQAFQQFLDACAEEIGMGRDATFTHSEVRAVLDRTPAAVRRLRSRLHPATVRHVTRQRVRGDLEDLVFGLGPLEDLIRTPGINEVMVVANDRIYIEKDGAVEETGRAFPGESDVEVAMQRILAPAGRTVNRSQPIVDARLSDGSRVHVVVPPIALRGAAITIRKFRKDPFTLEDLIRLGSVNQRAVSLLRGCVRVHKNIVISGGTGSGKTTLLNTLSSQIPVGERIVVIEDSAELQLQQPHVVQLEARKANMEGTGEISIRDLVKASLRMRPDRIVVGECRGGEALDMLQAMNTGHDGSLTTAHANSPRDMMQRLEVMVLTAAEGMPVSAIQRQIASAVDIVVQIARMRDKVRRVTAVTEIVGYDPEDGIIMSDILRLRPDEDGRPHLVFTGYLPSFIEAMLSEGDTSLEDLF